MRKLYYLAVLLLLCLAGCNDSKIVFEQEFDEAKAATRSALAPASYYWSGGERIWLDVDSARVIVRFADEAALSNFESSVSASASASSTTQITLTSSITRLPTEIPMAVVAQESMAAMATDVLFRQLGADAPIVSKAYAKTFHNSDVPFYLTGYILLRPRPGVSVEEIINTFEIDGEVTREWVGGSTAIRLNQLDKVMDIANAIHTSGMVAWSHPDFATIIETHSVPAAPFFYRQWNLRNTGQSGGTRDIDINVVPAWAITRGNSNIRVAVIDSGVDFHHEDLAGRVLPGFTPRRPHSLGRPSTLSHVPAWFVAHGQAVAGIIAASHNNLGIAGVAPNVQIVPVNIFYSDGQSSIQTIQNAVEAINFAWNEGQAHVINNSWSARSTSAPNQDLAIAISDAIENARTLGRGGLGSVVVFSSGNFHLHSALEDGFFNGVAFPANLPNVLTVGAIDQRGNVWDRSSRGPQLDLVAPGVDISTTDRMGVVGIEPANQHYTHRFTGTSASAPHVAGVAALILSVNPTLRESEVRTIIKSTANKNLPGVAFTVNRPPGGSWNPDVGHGLLNAHAAVSQAAGGAPAITGPTTVCPGVTNAVFELQNRPPNATVTWIPDPPLAIVGANNLDRVEVRHTGATAPINSRVRAEISMGGQVVHTVVHDVTVNRPTIQSIQGPIVIKSSDFTVFSVNHTGGTTFSWSISPDHGVVMLGRDLAELNLFIRFPGHYRMTVTVSNGCGTVTKNQAIYVTTGIDPPIIRHCPYCHTPNNFPPGCWRCPPPNMFREEEEES